MFAPLVPILGFTAIAFAAFGMGRPMLRAMRLDKGDRLTVAVFSLAFGAMAGAMAMLVLGASGRLTPSAISALTAIAGFWGVMEVALEWGAAVERKHLEADPHPLDIDRPAWTRPSRRLAHAFVAASCVAGLAAFLGALAPPADDALLERLEMPQRWLVQQRIDGAVIADHGPKFQPLPDLWHLWALGVEGGSTVQLTALGIGILAALATVLFASPVLGRSWAWAAGMLVAISPCALRHVVALDGHMASLLFCTLAAAAWRQGDDEGDWRWQAVAGIAMGGAMGTRALLPLLAVLALILVWNLAYHGQIEDRRDALRGIFFAGLAAATVGAVWSLPPMESSLCLPQREAFSWHALCAVLGGCGAAFLATAPGLLLTRPLRGLRPILIVLGLFVVGCLPLFPRWETLLAVAPLLATAMVWVWVELRRFAAPPRRVAMAALGTGVALMAFAPWGDSAGKAAAALGVCDREAWLGQRQPTWRAAEVANHLLPTTAQILSQDPRTFFFRRSVTTESMLCSRVDDQRLSEDPTRLGAQLRAAGFTHLLLVESATDVASSIGSRLRRLAEAQDTADGQNSPVLTDYLQRCSDGKVRRYRLVAIR